MAFSVDFYELHGYPKGRWDRGEFDGIRRIFCEWDDLLTLLTELDADPVWPYSFGPINAYVRRMDIEPFCRQTNDPGERYADYEYAICTIYHSTRGPTWYNETTWVEEEMFPAQSVQKIQFQQLRWDPPNRLNNQVNENLVEWEETPTKVHGEYIYRATFHRLTALPAWVLTRPGTVNINPFVTMILGITFVPDCLRYDGATINRKYTLGKLPYYDVTANFRVHSFNTSAPGTLLGVQQGGWNLHWNIRYTDATPGSGWAVLMREPALPAGGGGHAFVAGDRYWNYPPIIM